MFVSQRIRRSLAAVITVAAMSAGAAVAQTPVSEAQLETFLGLNVGTGLGTGDLTNLGNGPVTSGSAIMQTITVGVGGAKLSFDYDFLTNAPSPASNPLGALDPFGFTTLSPLTSFVDNFATLTAAPAQTGFAYQTGYETYSVNLAPGVYNWGIGIANVTTDQYSSGLLLSDVSLTSGSLVNGSFGTGDYSGWSTIGNTSVVNASFGVSPPGGGQFQAFLSTGVPEPSSIVLLVFGGVGMTIGYRRHRRALSHKCA
jgi:hypothetical protein